MHLAEPFDKYVTDGSTESDDQSLIVMRCQDCHEMQVGGELLRNPLPIDYDRHCSACHDLSTSALAGLPVTGSSTSVHAHKRDEIAELLRTEFGPLVSKQSSRSDDAVLAHPGRSRREATASRGADPATSNSHKQMFVDDIISRLFSRAENANSCYFCHDPADNEFKVQHMEPLGNSRQDGGTY